MKKLISSLVLCLLFVSVLQAQSKLSEKEVLGDWKLHIDLNKEVQNKNNEMNFLEKAIVGAVSGIVTTALEHVEVRFHFKRNHEVLLKIHLKEEDKHEEETLSWLINAKGQLEIEDLDNEKVNINNDGVWMMKGDVLILVNEDKSTEAVYLERLK